MPINLPEIKIGLLNVFWTNGSREKPVNLIPHKLLSDFETRTNLKINWSNDHNGVVELKGHYNYLIFRDSEYFFLTPLRVKDVEKNIFVYSVERDYWMGLLADESSYVRGSLIKTLDENVLWSFLQQTKALIGDPNTQEVFTLKEESDCATCSIIDRMEVTPFTKNQFGYAWNLTTQSLKQFIQDISRLANDNITPFKDATPFIAANIPLTPIPVWQNYIAELLNKWVSDKSLVVESITNIDKIAPGISKFLKHDSEKGMKDIYGITKKRSVGSFTSNQKIFEATEMRDFSLTKLDLSEITSINCVDYSSKASISVFNKSIFQLPSISELVLKPSESYSLGLRTFGKNNDVDFTPFKHSPSKSFKQTLFLNDSRLTELGFAAVTSPVRSEYFHSWLWTDKAFDKRKSEPWTAIRKTIPLEVGFAMYSIADYSQLTLKNWINVVDSPFVYTLDEKVTKLKFVTGLQLNKNFECGTESVLFSQIFPTINNENFWEKLNWSFLWDGGSISFSNMASDLLTVFTYGKLVCSSKPGEDVTVVVTPTTLNTKDNIEEIRIALQKRRENITIVEEKGCVTDNFVLNKGDIFWSNISHGLFKRLNAKSSLLIGDALDKNIPHLCLFYEGRTGTKSGVKTISVQAGWQFGLIRGYDFELKISQNENNLIQRVESDIEPIVYKIDRLIKIPDSDLKPHNEEQYNDALEKFIKDINKIPSVITVDGVRRPLREFTVSEIKHRLNSDGKSYIRAKLYDIEMGSDPNVMARSDYNWKPGGFPVLWTGYRGAMLDQRKKDLKDALFAETLEESNETEIWIFFRFKFTRETGANEYYNLKVITNHQYFREINRAFIKHLKAYNDSRKQATEVKNFAYRGWSELSDVKKAVTTISTAYNASEYTELQSQLEVSLTVEAGYLNELLQSVITTYQENSATSGQVAYSHIDKEYLQTEIEDNVGTSNNKIPMTHCFELKKGDSVEFFMYLKWHKNWSEPVIELVVANPSLLKHQSYTNLIPNNPQDLNTNNLYSAINQKNFLWIHGQLYPIQSKLVVSTGSSAPFAFSVTKLEINDPLFSKHRVLFEGPIGEVLDTIISIPQILNSDSYGVNEWATIARINLDIAEAQKNRRIELLRFDENRRLDNQTYQNKKEDIAFTESNYPFKVAGTVIGGLIGAVGGKVFGGNTESLGKIDKGNILGGLAIGQMASSLMTGHIEHGETMRKSGRDARQTDAGNAISLIHQRMSVNNKHATDELRERNQLLELSYNMRSSTPNGADEIEAIQKIMTGGSPVAIIHRRPSKELLKHITVFYDRYGVDIFINDYTLVFKDLDITKNHIIQFSHIDEFTIHDHSIREYLRLLLETGVRLKYHDYKASNSDIAIQRQIHITKTQTAQAARELARLESEALQLKIAAQRNEVELNVAELKEELRVQAHLIIVENKKAEEAVKAKEKAEEALENVELSQHATTLAAINAALSNTDQGRIINQLNRKLATAKELTANAEVKISAIEAERDAANDEKTKILDNVSAFREILIDLESKKKRLVVKQDRFLREMLYTLDRHATIAWGNYVYLIIRRYGNGAYDSGPLYPNYYLEKPVHTTSPGLGYWYWDSEGNHKRMATMFDDWIWADTHDDRIRLLAPHNNTYLRAYNETRWWAWPLYGSHLNAAVIKTFYNAISSFDEAGIPSYTRIHRYQSQQKVVTDLYVDGNYWGIELFHHTDKVEGVDQSQLCIYIVVHKDYWKPGDGSGLQLNHARLMTLQEQIDAIKAEIKTAKTKYRADLINSHGYDGAYVDQIFSSITDDFVI